MGGCTKASAETRPTDEGLAKRRGPTLAAVDRRSALLLLAVLGAGVFLTGLELMVTAVALPAIVVDLADWSALRKASWIVNGYLLASVITMPIAGRLADRFGVRRLFLFALVVFGLGSALSGRAQSLEELIGARILQAVGGGILVPVATAAASHLFEGDSRPRALGVIGALTFLGMAAGPFVGAWILGAVHPDPAFGGAFDAPWRYVFYLNVPIAIAAFAVAWAASGGWETERSAAHVDILGAVLATVGLAGLLVGLTLAGSQDLSGLPITVDPGTAVAGLVVAGLALTILGVLVASIRGGPIVRPQWFRAPAFSSAALVSLLTGYGFATAIIGGAVFVDRVLYGGPDIQRIALGALAAATAAGALASGFVLRLLGLRITTTLGLVASIVALWRMAAWSPATPIAEIAAWLALFGAGFGLTVTPRSTSAVEALGRSAFGIASATVTVARMLGMAVGLAVLTAFGSTIIDQLRAAIFVDPGYQAFIPPELRNRGFEDGLVVQALESWASGEAAKILVGIFLVAAAVMAVALVPALALGRGAAADRSGSPAERASDAEEGSDARPSFAL
jgi:MFS family permease